MSVAAALVHEAGLTPEQAEYVGIPLSWQQYEALGEDVRGEYIGGRLYVNAFPTFWHQVLCERVCQQLRPQLPTGHVAVMGIGWKPARDEFGPDVLVLRLADHDVRAPRFTGRPLLVVEVLSRDASRDTVVKAHRYARAGAPQYWLVHPEGPLEVLALESADEGIYRVAHRLSDAAEQVVLADGTEITVDPKALFAPYL